MKKFKLFFDEYKKLHQPQRDVNEDPTPKQSPQAKLLILRNNLKYNTKTNSYDALGNVRVYEKDLTDGHLPVQIGEVGGHFEFVNCSHLTSLKNCPKKVGKNFGLYHCINLTSLAYGPEEVGYFYDCRFTAVKNLEGIAQYIGQSLWCSYCDNLTTLNGLGLVLKKVFCEQCPNLKITDLEREKYEIVEKS